MNSDDHLTDNLTVTVYLLSLGISRLKGIRSLILLYTCEFLKQLISMFLFFFMLVSLTDTMLFDTYGKVESIRTIERQMALFEIKTIKLI